MKYILKNLINKKNASMNKIFITELNEIYSILKLLYKGNKENKSKNNALINIGIIDNENDMFTLEKLFSKNLNFSLDDLTSLCNNLPCCDKCDSCPVNKYCNYYRKQLSTKFDLTNYPTMIDLFCRSWWAFSWI